MSPSKVIAEKWARCAASLNAVAFPIHLLAIGFAPGNWSLVAALPFSMNMSRVGLNCLFTGGPGDSVTDVAANVFTGLISARHRPAEAAQSVGIDPCANACNRDTDTFSKV
jgi:hypothetical protein